MTLDKWGRLDIYLSKQEEANASSCLHVATGLRVGSPMIGWERIQGGKANLKRWVLSFERNVETDNELRVSGGREFQSLGAMTEKALLPRDVRTYGMDRTDRENI